MLKFYSSHLFSNSMQQKAFPIILLLSLFISNEVITRKIIKLSKAQSEFALSYFYYVDSIKNALLKDDKYEYGVALTAKDMLEGKTLSELPRKDGLVNIYQMEKKYYDYFPRDIIAAYAEMDVFRNGQLQVYNRIISHYPYSVYFFVLPDEEQPEKDIEKKLIIAIGDDSFTRYFKDDPGTAFLSPLEKKWKSSLLFKLKNKYFLANTPIYNLSLWLSIQYV